jgi:L-alanine-DL-glutamate epimerase-like enolase superfamily enzyme
VHAAVDIGRQLQDAGVWLSILEDPADHNDHDGLAHITRMLSTPIMAGESNWGVAPFAHMIRQRSVDILMVDLLHVGGYTAGRKIAAMAEGANMPLVSHLLPEFSAHLIAGIPNGLICEHKEWMWPLFDGLPDLKDGAVHLSARPGHGLSLAPDFKDIF